jgi:hypothetical protein
MPRIFKYRNFGVYVADARGEPHQLPHAHIKDRGSGVCSVNLFDLEPLQQGIKLGAGLLAELKSHQLEMLAEWGRLNPDEPR